MPGSNNGYYGLSWYTQGHERYCYLLGLEVAPASITPVGAILKQILATTFAVAGYAKGENIIEAWNEFFYDRIPDGGYTVNEEINLYFEFYPGVVDGEYELWVSMIESMKG